VDSTYGVRRLVKHGDRPSPLPGAFMRSLIEMTNESGIFSYSSRVATGDRVQFLSGPFAGMIGTLEALDTHGRITILLTLLGQSTRVRAKVNDIVPASTM
jgi:transcriptional antiterminator RfaH